MKATAGIFRSERAPLRLNLLILPQSSVLSVASVLDPMRAANRLAKAPVFEWQVLSVDGAPVNLTCGIELPAQGEFNEHESADAMVIVAGFDQQRYASAAFVRKLRRAAQNMRAMGGIESGSWLLARAGLLDGHQATTHWEDLEDFALAFHQVRVVLDRFVISGRYFTAGGASPALDMMLHLVRCRYGAPLALQVASAFVYDEVHLSSDRQPHISLGRLDCTEPRVATAIRLMEDNLQQPLSSTTIAAQTGVSVRRLETLFRRELDVSPARYYRRLRLQEARRLVTDTRHSLQTIAVRTGFSSQSTFCHAFSQRYGQSARTMRTTQSAL